MIIHSLSPSLNRLNFSNVGKSQSRKRIAIRAVAAVRLTTAAVGAFAAAVVMMVSVVEAPQSQSQSQSQPQSQAPPQDGETLSNIPQTLSGEDFKKQRIQKPKSRNAEKCTVKCVNTCIRGGDGAPGEGPLNIRRPLVVFKQGFRSRNYCLVECSDICNLIGDGDYGP